MILGVSSCLLGNMCRYDGHGAKDDFVFNSLNSIDHFILSHDIDKFYFRTYFN
mgnify:CR=1 FL=1